MDLIVENNIKNDRYTGRGKIVVKVTRSSHDSIESIKTYLETNGI